MPKKPANPVQLSFPFDEEDIGKLRKAVDLYSAYLKATQAASSGNDAFAEKLSAMAA